jgi:hypothetical protein
MRLLPWLHCMRARRSGDWLLVLRARLPEKIVVLLVVVFASLGTLSTLPGCASARSRGASHKAAPKAQPLVRSRPLARSAEGVASEYRRLTSEIVHGYASSPERYYANGVWQNGDPSCWYCNLGPAVGAAYLSTTEPSMLPVAVASMNGAIADYRRADGSFSGNTSPAITSAAFGVLLGLTYVRLAPQLDEATRVRWRQTLTGIADYLISDRDVTWYANGNINSSYAAALYFAWRAGGEQKYLDAYNAELQFLVAPTGKMWVGFGLTITQMPTRADGSDGRAVLAEGSPPGWDPEYAHLQLDFLSALYSASNDPRVLRLLNMILNQELTRVDTTSFILDAQGGTRKSHTMPFTSAALPLLVVDGNRPDLAPLLPAAFARLSSEYLSTLRYTQHNFYRGVALWLAPLLLATSNVPAEIPPPGATSMPSGAVGSPPGGASTTTGPGRGVGQSHAAPPTAGVTPHAPVISPHVLNAASLVRVAELEIPTLEYAFATPTALTRGVAGAGANGARLTFAAIACTGKCRLSIRPELIVHRLGEQSPVVVQSNLPSSMVTLRAGQPFVSRVLVSRLALQAARQGRSVFVRIRLTLLGAGRAPQGRSTKFKVVWG